MTVYQIIARAKDCIDDDGDCVLWLDTSVEPKIPHGSTIINVSPIDHGPKDEGIDLVIK